jgi:hypothetical protein
MPIEVISMFVVVQTMTVRNNDAEKIYKLGLHLRWCDNQRGGFLPVMLSMIFTVSDCRMQKQATRRPDFTDNGNINDRAAGHSTCLPSGHIYYGSQLAQNPWTINIQISSVS